MSPPKHSWFRCLERRAVGDVDDEHLVAEAVIQLATVSTPERIGTTVCRNMNPLTGRIGHRPDFRLPGLFRRVPQPRSVGRKLRRTLRELRLQQRVRLM